MPVGINKVVPRFVRGHVYKIYYLNTPDEYVILRFKRKDTIGSEPSIVYVFSPMADNTNHTVKFTRVFVGMTRAYSLKAIATRNVEEVRLVDLPKYLGAKLVGQEFERVLRGEPIFRRNKSQIRKSKSAEWYYDYRSP